MKQARIALVIGQTTGGIGRHVSALVSEVVERGGNPQVFGPETTRAFGFEARGATFHPLEVPSRAASVNLFLKSSELTRLLGGTDLVHAHGLRAGAVAGRAARRAGVAARIVTIHNAVLDRKGARAALAWLGDRLLARQFSVRICVSNDLARLAMKANPSNAGSVRVIPVGSDVGPMQPDQAERLRDSLGPLDGGLVVAVGRLDRQKGFDVLVDSIQFIAKRPLPLIAIAGEGPERPRLEKRIAQSRSPDRVLLLGWRNDAPLLIGAADIFCMPSRWEGSPLTLHEAMTYGKAIVATKVGGIADMVSPKEAILVPSENPHALAGAINHLLEDNDLRRRLGECAAARAAEWPDAARSASRVVDVYEGLLGRPLMGRE